MVLMVLILCELENQGDFWAFGLDDFMSSYFIYQDKVYFSPSTQSLLIIDVIT